MLVNCCLKDIYTPCFKLSKSVCEVDAGKILFKQGQTKKDAPCLELLHSLTNSDVVKMALWIITKILLDTGSQTLVARADLVAKEKWDLNTQSL